MNANIAMTANTSISISAYGTTWGLCLSNLHGGKVEAACECKRFDDCDHFDFNFRMRYPKPNVNANTAMFANASISISAYGTTWGSVSLVFMAVQPELRSTDLPHNAKSESSH